MRNLDREKALLQKNGSLNLLGLTLRDVVEIATDLGVELDDLEFKASPVLRVKEQADA